MNFVSTEFFIIVLATIVLYFVCPKKYRWVELLCASCYFYFSMAGWQAFLVATTSAAVSFGAGLWIEKSEEHRKRKLCTAIGVVVILSALVVTKLSRYFQWEVSWIIIPLGISYYTFSLVGYMMDVYAKKQAAEKNFLKLLLYTLYYPKIIQGPISKFRELGPKLITPHEFSYQNLSYGWQRIAWGYFKKLVIVERAGFLTAAIFDGEIGDYTGGGALLIVATFIGVIRFYCDFSAYMDIVIGISQIMGIELEENFRQPFFSKTAAEYWRRWHMTLGIWFKDYVYMLLVINPKVIAIGKWFRDHVGKKAAKNVVTIIPLAVVWILTGLWHGTGLNYLVWGCYWGTIIIISNVFAPNFKKLKTRLHIKATAWWYKGFEMIRTFCIFTLGLMISNLVGITRLKSYAWFVIKDFAFDRLSFSTMRELGLKKADAKILFGAIIVLFLVDIWASREDVRARIAKFKAPLRWFIYFLLLFAIFFLGIYGEEYTLVGFEYARF